MMLTLEVLSQPVWQHIAWTLLHFVWQGALIGMALVVALGLLRSTQARYLAALAALLLMIACPAATLAWKLSLPGSELASMAMAEPIDVPTTRSWSDYALTQLQVWQRYVLLAWMSGVVLLSLRLLLSYVGVCRLRRSGELLSAERLPLLAILKHRMRLSTAVRAAASHSVREAMVIGLWRPLILLPAAWLTEMPAPTLEAILAHELAHIRRHDLWVNLLQRVTETLLFYHPAVWYVSRVLRVEREKCCDELAVAATGQRLAYVEALELVAHRRLAASPSVWATAMGGARTMNLLERVRNVLGLRPATSAGQYWPVGIAALLLPLGLWCVTAAISPSVQADDDKPSAEAKKDGDKEKQGPKDGEKEKEGPKDGEKKKEDGNRDRPEESRRDEARRDGDRPREGEARRDGDRPREGDRPRDGDRPREGGVRRDGDGRLDGDRRREEQLRREGDRPREGEGRRTELRGPFPPGDRPREGQGPIPPDLMRVIAELRMEVQQLRREVNELRDNRGPLPKGVRPEGPRRDGERRPEGGPRDGDRPRGEGDRPRPEGERRPEGDRPRGEGERPRPEGERRPEGVR